MNNVAPGYTLTERQDELARRAAQALGKTKGEMIALWAHGVAQSRHSSDRKRSPRRLPFSLPDARRTITG